jgi:hypothetical protein
MAVMACDGKLTTCPNNPLEPYSSEGLGGLLVDRASEELNYVNKLL